MCICTEYYVYAESRLIYSMTFIRDKTQPQCPELGLSSGHGFGSGETVLEEDLSETLRRVLRCGVFGVGVVGLRLRSLIQFLSRSTVTSWLNCADRPTSKTGTRQKSSRLGTTKREEKS